jgi:predicted MFS family arabinose efflux permease
MALTVNRSPDHERAAALSSFTMFFEIGTVSGGLMLGVVAEAFSKQAAFATSVVVLGFGLWLLRTKVVPVRARQSYLAAPAPTFVPSAGD